MTKQITENDYLDMLDEIEMTEAMEKIVNDVILTIDAGMIKLQPSERVAVGMQIATLVGTNTLANALRDHRHLLNPAVEKLAEDMTNYVEAMFEVMDTDAPTTH